MSWASATGRCGTTCGTRCAPHSTVGAMSSLLAMWIAASRCWPLTACIASSTCWAGRTSRGPSSTGPSQSSPACPHRWPPPRQPRTSGPLPGSGTGTGPTSRAGLAHDAGAAGAGRRGELGRRAVPAARSHFLADDPGAGSRGLRRPLDRAPAQPRAAVTPSRQWTCCHSQFTSWRPARPTCCATSRLRSRSTMIHDQHVR